MKTVHLSNAVWRGLIASEVDLLRNIVNVRPMIRATHPRVAIRKWMQFRLTEAVHPGDIPNGDNAVRTLMQLLAAGDNVEKKTRHPLAAAMCGGGK